MFVNFDKLFNKTEKEQQETLDRMKQIREEFRNRPKPDLLPCKDNMMISNPFMHFYGDCTYCKHYANPNVGFVEGGWCRLKNNVGCGWGFTCDEFDKVKIYL